MSQYDNSNRGGLWGNKNKQSDNHPDFTGHINIDGKEYWLSGWKRKPDQSDRAPALSLSIKLKEESPSRSYQAPAAAQNEDFEEDIPF